MRQAWVAVVLVAAVLAGCGSSSSPGPDEVAAGSPTQSGNKTKSPSAPPQSPSTAPSTAPPTKDAQRGHPITTAGSAYGTMLFDRSGQAIYLFDKETTSKPQCYGACAKAWPPVLTNGAPRISGAVRPELVGTTRREDGSRQVTYAGQPLYFYAHEGKRQVLCHNVAEFGGLWLVVTPGGQPAA